VVPTQGISTTAAGRGALNAAYGGLGQPSVVKSLSDNPNLNALKDIYDYIYYYARLNKDCYLMTSPPMARLGQLSGVAFPLIWGSLFSFFSAGRGPRWLCWGAGGHFVVTAGAMLAAWGLMVTADPKTLYIADGD
jgi:hypothetical protein